MKKISTQRAQRSQSGRRGCLLLTALLVVTSGCAATAPQVANAPAANPPVTNPTDQWRARQSAGVAAYEREDNAAAETEFKAALEIVGQADSMALGRAVSENALAVLYVDDGRLDEAGPLLDDAITVFETQQGSTALYMDLFAGALTNRGHLRLLTDKPVEAERDYRRALAIGSDRIHDRALSGVVASLCAQGKDAEAAAAGKPLGIDCATQ